MRESLEVDIVRPRPKIEDDSPLIDYIKGGELDKVKSSILNDKSLLNKGRDHPLHLAIDYSQPEIFEFLLSQDGIDVNTRSSSYVKSKDQANTVLIRLAMAGRTDDVKTLLKKGADTSLTGASGRTAAEWALHKEHSDILMLINSTFTATQSAPPSPSTSVDSVSSEVPFMGEDKGEDEDAPPFKKVRFY